MISTRVIAVDRDAPDPAAIAAAAALLRGGGLVAFATETVYGLGADATRLAAIERLYAVKGRPSTNPLIVHVADVAMARRYARAWPPAADRLAQALWPGPVTLVLPKTSEIPDEVTAGLPTVGLRVPAPAVARRLISEAAIPVAAPSANVSEHVSPTRAEHVLADLDGRIDCVLDSGPTDVGIESTVIDVTTETPRVLRPGPIDDATIARIVGPLGTAPAVADASAPAASPGHHPRHYAPRTLAVRVETIEALAALRPTPRDAVFVFGAHAAAPRGHAGPTFAFDDARTAARELYAALRDCDDLGLDRLLVALPPDTGSWRAVRDRLVRATVPPPPVGTR